MARNGIGEEPLESQLARSSISQTPTLLFVVAATAVFAAEAGLMLVLAVFHEQMTVWQQALTDALLLILVLFPLFYLVYLFTFRPVRLHNAELLQIGKQLQEQVADRREAEAALRQSEKQLHLLSAQLLTVHENERQRVSRELHEDLGQSLIVLKLRLRRLEDTVNQDQPAARQELRGASEQIDDMIRHIRRLSRDLSPAILEDLGFTTAARRLISNYAGDSGVNPSVTIDAEVDKFLQGAEGILTYRILQEALENIQNHAEASRFSVAFSKGERELSMVVEDDGRGFDSSREEDRGLGLAAMYERARMLNGSLDVSSGPGRGTRLTLKIPTQRDTAAHVAEE